MSKKKLNGDGIYFTGESSNDVTGSQYLVKFGETQCLLECGLYQSASNSYLDSYQVNSKKFAFSPADIDFVFINHPHIDHCGLLPRLVKKGFSGKIITTAHTAAVMKPLLLNSCYIVNEEARILSKRYGRAYLPLYEECDVKKAFSLISIYDEYGKTHVLNDFVSFKWIENSHCLGAAQLLLILKNKEKTRKILYTSDLGSLKNNNNYMSKTKIPVDFSDITVMESTYGDKKRISKHGRKFDVERLKTAIDTTIERGGSVIMPCFSFSRTQEILTVLYDIYGNDSNFNNDIVVDSKLSCEICKLYNNILSGANLEKWNNVYNWNNVKFIVDKQDSRDSVADKSPRVIISSSGFCTNGRIVNYLKNGICDRKNMIVFSGYTGNNSSYLSYRIKNYDKYRTVKINKVPIKNNADCISLHTFSSHATHDDLVKFGGNLNTNKLILVHGSKESKEELSSDLENEISKNNKTYKIKCACRGMVIRL